MTLTFSRLDPFDPCAREEYETAFYEAFARVTTNTLVRRLWRWDDQHRRLATRIDYDDQRIYIGRNQSGALTLAIAATVAPSRWQSAEYGFTPQQCGADACEVLTFFATTRLSGAVIRPFWRRFLTAIKALGVRSAYATCAASMLPLYEFAGWKIADMASIDGEQRYFLTLQLDEHPSKEAIERHALTLAASGEAEARLIAALCSGGDPRLDCTPPLERNIYGCGATPDPDEISFGATTISTISARAFDVARVRFCALSEPSGGVPQRALGDEAAAIAQEIAELSGCRGAKVLLAPSGTDAVVYTTLLIAGRCSSPVTTIVTGLNETGSGVGNAVLGRHFIGRTPQGHEVTPGEPIITGHDLCRIDLPLRDTCGRRWRSPTSTPPLTPMRARSLPPADAS